MNLSFAGTRSLEEINRLARGGAEAFVRSEEARCREGIASVARRIAQERPMSRLVMLSGPSSSGKTTTAHFLVQALEREGVGSVSISLDDFYLGEGMAPLLPDGRRDYECLEALDVGEIRSCIGELAEKGRCEMPVFDFEQHVRYPHRRQVVLGENGVAVVEGIHALNPALLSGLPALRLHRVYISVAEGVADEAGNQLLAPDDIRLLRRTVRDHNFRQTRPDETLFMWPNVMSGERRFVAPYRGGADVRIDSFHAYELCALRGEALSLLGSIPTASPNRARAEALAAAVGRFAPVSPALVPEDSLLREFLGSCPAQC